MEGVPVAVVDVRQQVGTELQRQAVGLHIGAWPILLGHHPRLDNAARLGGRVGAATYGRGEMRE